MRLVVWLCLAAAAFGVGNGFAQSSTGCLPTNYVNEPITWNLPTTPGTPNWTINSTGLTVSGFPAMPVSVPFSATFWRRPECATQLLLTLNLSGSVQVLGSWSAYQGGVSTPFVDMIVNDPAAYGGNDLLLLGSTIPPGAISGVVNFSLLSSRKFDVSQAMTIDFTPETLSGAGPVVSIQIPAAANLAPPPFTIGNGMTGSWYDPSESGHGYSIEVLPGNTLLAYWYVFAPNGGQSWIVATGPITGNTAVLTAFQALGSGGMFPPNFNAAKVQEVPWGTITFTFTDCNTGTASWQPTVAGYTAGSIPITRLTMPAGLTCP